ncbi:MAG TPA: polysaccharide biosynthesis/export family protein [Pyrinomonadaceae bacterium]|nr:polysaccharide biosynthesis/export family protein [Pyrinomonadaceae bacterium]
MNRALPLAALLACALGVAAAPARAQANTRVGPDAEESSAPAAKNGEAKRAAAKDERKGEPSKGEAKKAEPRDTSPTNSRQPKDERVGGGESDATNPPATASVAAPVGPSTSTPSATSDAPQKSGAAAPPPVVTQKGTLTAEPTAALPNPSSNASGTVAAPPPTAVYNVGVGDVLDIRLLNQAYTRESTLFTVMAGGLLEYPLAGEPVPVGGLTPQEIAARLEVALKRRAVFLNPRVSVSVRDYASHTVMVSGLVEEPGVKIIRREAIPLYVVIAEAQPKPEAGRAVVMSHKTGRTLVIDLSDAAAMGALVFPGDVINLTTKPQEFYYIGGEVVVPGQKDFHAGMTLTQAVLASGGTTAAAGAKVRVSRQDAGGLLVSHDYDLKLIQDGKVPDPRLEAGDRVEVGRAGKKQK